MYIFEHSFFNIILNVVFSCFEFVFLEIEGSHLFGKVGETISYTNHYFTSLFLDVALKNDEKPFRTKSWYINFGADMFGRHIVIL